MAPRRATVSDARSSSSEGYRSIPIAEPWGEAGWRAGVLLQGDDARGDRPIRSLGARIFESADSALDFARSEYGDLGAATPHS